MASAKGKGCPESKTIAFFIAFVAHRGLTPYPLRARVTPAAADQRHQRAVVSQRGGIDGAKVAGKASGPRSLLGNQAFTHKFLPNPACLLGSVQIVCGIPVVLK